MTRTKADWQARAAAADRGVAAFIDGDAVATGGAPVRLVNPADGAPGLDYRAAESRIVDAAVDSARAADGGGRWQAMPPAARRECLLRLADLMSGAAEAIGLHDSLDVGKPIGAACMEVQIAASMCRYFGEIVDKLYTGQTVPTEARTLELHLRRPRGTVAAIVPWNYPIINATLKLAPALAAGNSVVLKPSELSPGSALQLARLCIDAGIPAGTVNVVPGDASTGEALAMHAGVDMITFTGSTATGKALLRAAGSDALKPLLLECGGKSPELVFEDARGIGIDAIAGAIVAGAFANQGQLCVARTRLIVERSLHDELVAALQRALASLAPGHPLDPATTFGPLASVAQYERVCSYVNGGVEAGATLAVDGRAATSAAGCYLGPNLFTEVDPSTAIAREEIFGPVLCVFPVDGEDEAVALANDSAYGLAATAWTTDLARGHRLAGALRAGKLRITATAEPRFGAGWSHESEPVGQSGFGVEGGRAGVESYTRLQAVQIDF